MHRIDVEDTVKNWRPYLRVGAALEGLGGVHVWSSFPALDQSRLGT